MIAPERLLVNRQRTLVERLGVGVAALVVIEQRQIVQRRRDLGMIAPECLLVNGQRTLVQRLGVGVAGFAAIQLSQIVQRRCDLGMVAPEHLFANGQDLLRDWNGVRVPSGVVKLYDLFVEFVRLICLLRRYNRWITKEERGRENYDRAEL